MTEIRGECREVEFLGALDLTVKVERFEVLLRSFHNYFIIIVDSGGRERSFRIFESSFHISFSSSGISGVARFILLFFKFLMLSSWFSSCGFSGGSWLLWLLVLLRISLSKLHRLL